MDAIALRRDPRGQVEDAYVHHSMSMRDANGTPRNDIRAHCGVKHGFHTDDVATLLSHPNGCPTCKRFYREAVEEEMNERVRSKYRDRE